MSLAIITSLFIPMMVNSIKAGSDDDKLHKATLASIGLGIGEVFGALMHG